MLTAVLATRNPHKLVELERILSAYDVTLRSLADWPGAPDPAETGETFADNALIKARSAAASTGLLALADDSGLCVDALNGMPGVLSVYWAGRARDDAANLQLVLEQIADVPDQRRGGAFVCAAAAVCPDGRELVVEGRMPGRILREPRGARGFGYDPIFAPEGLSVTSAELAPEDKDAISHRGRAFRALAERLLPPGR